MSNMIHVTASNPRTTSYDVRSSNGDATDIDVCVTMPDGATLSGTVTLLPPAGGEPGLSASWAMGPDNWISGALLKALKDSFDGDDFSSALSELESAAAQVAG